MPMYLLDTNVVSELRKPRRHGAVLAWLQGVDDLQLHLAAMTVGEIQASIEITRQQDTAKAAELETWLARAASSCNVILIDAAAFRMWAQLMHRKSETIYEDAMIAAIAKVHSLAVVTRNTGGFKALGAPLVNPFEGV